MKTENTMSNLFAYEFKIDLDKTTKREIKNGKIYIGKESEVCELSLSQYTNLTFLSVIQSTSDVTSQSNVAAAKARDSWWIE